MPRSGDAARARLRAAALELYERDGFDATTTAGIAAAAGVTERTFFRHFTDKREALFDGETELRDTMTTAVTTAPANLGPFDLVRRAYLAAVPLFVAGRSEAMRREQVIATSPALRERADAKSSAVTAAITEALIVRGVARPTARLSARLGATVFERAYSEWDGRSAIGLERLLHTAETEAVDLVQGSRRTRRSEPPC